MPPLVPLAAAAAGTVLLVRFMTREWRRINLELDRVEGAEKPPENGQILRRDPETGDWRP